MYKLEFTENDVADCHDDFMVNEEYELYDFIDNDIEFAFILGMYFIEWYQDLNRDQKYLYSKQWRHNIEELDEYIDQINYWINKCTPNEGEIDMIQMSEDVLNNIIFQPDDEYLIINLALFLGNMTGKAMRNEKE